MQVYCGKNHANSLGNRFCIHCGEPLPLLQGQTIENRYRIVRQLGQGGFGRTYLAEDLNRSQQACALKEFAPQVEKPEDINKAKELFEREANVLKALQHPQIPRFHTSLQPKLAGKDFFFLVQDYIEGDSYLDILEKRLQQGETLTESEVILLLERILPVLAYIHSKNVIHRDISPDNILLRSSDNLPVLIDFGGVKQLPASKGFWFTQLGVNKTLLGKKGYAPEEQLRQGQAFPSSDLYSLAVTALVLLTGKDPQELYDSFQGNWRWGEAIKVSPRFEAVLKKMLAYKPSDRYQNADLVLKDLQNLSTKNFQTQGGKQQLQTSPATAPATPAKPVNPMITKIRTMVAAPGKNLRAAGGQRSKTVILGRNFEIPIWVRPFATTLVGSTVVGLIFAGTWAGVTAIIKGVQSIQVPSISLPTLPGSGDSGNNPSGGNSGSRTRGEQVLARRQKLEIPDAFFNNLVNDIFYTKNPELQGRNLGSSQEDAKYRQEWVSVADDLLNKIEQANLSTAARRRLGNYSARDYQRWVGLIDAGRLGEYTVERLNRETNQKFDRLFPGVRQGNGRLNQKTYAQIWYALAAETVSKAGSRE